MYNVGGNGNYWSSSPNSTDNSRNLNFNSTNLNPLNNNNRANGFSVRPARIRHQMQQTVRAGCIASPCLFSCHLPTIDIIKVLSV